MLAVEYAAQGQRSCFMGEIPDMNECRFNLMDIEFPFGRHLVLEANRTDVVDGTMKVTFSRIKDVLDMITYDKPWGGY